MMTGRKQNNTNSRGNFGAGKKPGIQNQNKNRMGGSKSTNFSGNLTNQVSPWLPQNNVSGLGNFGRNIGSDPQAQLALASNLLNNLLAPTSQLNKFAPPPSLLSLGGISNSSSSYVSSSYNRDRFGVSRSNFVKPQRRDDFKNIGKNKRFGDRKNQKKDQTNKKVTDQKNAEKKDVDKKEEVKVDNTDINQSVRGKGDEKTQYDQLMDTDAKNIESKKPAVEEPKVNYAEVPPALFFCHICRKHMWDDLSFEKHLEGRPHKMMVEELDRSYKLKVALLRHETRVMEQQRENDIQRAHRKGKSKVKMQQRGFCTMCDLSFLGMLPAHRKNERHQRLKKFLHPKCNACSKEFYTRLDWDDHKLTAAHLKKIAEIRKKSRPNLEETEFDISDFIDDINEEIETDLVDIKVTGKRESLDELKGKKPVISPNGSEEVEKDENEDEKGENYEEVKGEIEVGRGETVREEKTETEEAEKGDEDEESKKLPKYSPGIPVGLNFVVEKSGLLCKVCNRFVLSPEDSKTHCQSIIHYNNTIKILKIQNKIVYSKRRSNDVKNEDEDKTDEASETNEASVSIDGNKSKRRKPNESKTVVNGSTSGSISGSVSGTISGNALEKDETSFIKGTEKYDPEDPESETEKDIEKVSNEVIEPELLLEDVKKEVIAEVLKAVQAAPEPEVLKAVQTTPEPVKEEKKNVRTPARGQRARRARRN